MDIQNRCILCIFISYKSWIDYENFWTGFLNHTLHRWHTVWPDCKLAYDDKSQCLVVSGKRIYQRIFQKIELCFGCKCEPHGLHHQTRRRVSVIFTSIVDQKGKNCFVKTSWWHQSKQFIEKNNQKRQKRVNISIISEQPFLWWINTFWKQCVSPEWLKMPEKLFIA